MCTAISFSGEHGYFGRTLDVDRSYGETLTFVPGNYPLKFRNMGTDFSHYAILGMAHVVERTPLFFDGFNEKGLAMAGLNFEGFASYRPIQSGKYNVAHFELISWVLSRCDSAEQAAKLLAGANITDQAFSESLPVSHLHWIIGDQKHTVTVEAVKEGLKIYANPVGVLTNNPGFEQQLFHLNQYLSLTSEEPVNRFSDLLDLRPCSRGMGAWGLPGDLSSQSRFVRAAFAKLHSVKTKDDVGQFFHILDTVSQTKGCCKVGDGYEYTAYTSCCDLDRKVYYYTTYENRGIQAVVLDGEDRNGNKLVRYPLVREQQISLQNKKPDKQCPAN